MRAFFISIYKTKVKTKYNLEKYYLNISIFLNSIFVDKKIKPIIITYTNI